MIHTEPKVEEKPSRAEMIAFLQGHFRYHTMNSWNGMKSYARNVKIHNLGLTKEQRSRAYNLILAEEAYIEINDRLREFAEEHNYEFQAAFNGRSSGYIVLYQGGKEPSGYRSYCTRCGQMNYKLVPPTAVTPEDHVRNFIRNKNWRIPEVYPGIEEIKKYGLSDERVLEIVKEVKAEKAEYTEDDICGRCDKHGRVNFETPHMRVYTKSVGLDEGADFENEDEWSWSDLKNRYDVVKSFDKMVDDCIEIFKGLCDNYEAVEEEVPCTRKVIVMRERAKKEEDARAMPERSMDEIKSTCDKACEILERTHDGSDLDPLQLHFVECAVNGLLTGDGLKTFEELHKEVMSGQYKKPPFHGIEHMSIDGVGYVYWKGHQIDHFTLRWAYTDEAHKQALTLAERCKILEKKGIVPDQNTVIWGWKEEDHA